MGTLLSRTRGRVTCSRGSGSARADHVRKMLARYAKAAGITRSVSPHKWRHFLFTWLKKQGIDDALIQPYSGHESRQSLEIYSKLSLADAQQEYDQVMGRFPIQ